MKTILQYSLLMLLILGTAGSSSGQVHVGVDLMSRYVWRGTDFGNSPSIQPSISYTAGGLEIGAWAAVATTGNPDGTEIDFFASYGFETPSGTFSLVLTDYTFPESPQGQFFRSTSHFVEGGIGYESPGGLLSVFTGMFFLNDDDYSVYSELGLSVSAFDFHFGFTPAASAMYGTEKAGVINTGVSASRGFALSPDLTLTLSTWLIFNPYMNNGHLLFGISL